MLIVGGGDGGRLVVRELARNPQLRPAPGRVRRRRSAQAGDQGRVRPEGARDDRERGPRAGARRGRARRGRDRDPVRAGDAARARGRRPAASAGSRCARRRPCSSCSRTAPASFEVTRQLREVRVEDILGREPVRIELERVGAYLAGEVVLVTGAGGSIGGELCRQIARVGPRRLVLVDHAEDNLFEILRELEEDRHVRTAVPVLADCKEEERMREVLAEHRPAVDLPRRRLQARDDDGAEPGRGDPQQRAGHAAGRADRRRVRRRDVRARVDRQGGQARRP